MKKFYIPVLTIFAFLFLSIAPVKVVAEDNSSTKPTGQATQTNNEGKLTEVKLRVCQTKQATIQNRSGQLIKMAENMLTNFGQIASRVEKYYTDKVVPSGKTVLNYNALLAEISAKKKVAQTDLDKASTDAKVFDCTGNNPKEQLTQFRTDMQMVKKDLQDYRKAIINLISAIHSVTGTTESTSNTTKK